MIRRALKYLLTAPLLLAASCVTEGEHPDIVEVPDQGDMLTMRLKLDMGIEGRAESGESSSPGYQLPEGAFESVSTLRVIILHGNDNTVEAARIVSMKDGVPDNDKLEFKVRSNEMKTIILIANELSLPSPDPAYETASDYLTQFMTRPNAPVKISESQMQQLMDWKAAMPGTLPDATAGLFSDSKYGKHLPLTEIFKVQTVAIEPTSEREDVMQDVTLFMPYAAAKATFRFITDHNYKGPGSKVTGIRLLGINWSEYVFPKETTYSPAKYTGQGEGYVNIVDGNRRYINDFASVDLPAGREGTGSYTYTLEEPFLFSETIGEYGPIYFPESINKARATTDEPDANNFRVQVELEGLGWLDAQPLVSDILHVDGFDAIARNTHLVIEIHFGEKYITWNAIEAPYNTVTLKPGFGI